MTDKKPTTVLLSGTPEKAAIQIYQCQKQWDELNTTGAAEVRFCDHCRQEVHRVVDIDGIERAVAQGWCVMVAGNGGANKSGNLFVGQPREISYGVSAMLPVQDD